MSAPATPRDIRNRPCVACGSTRTIRWIYGGQVYCHDGITCGRRMIAALSVPPFVPPVTRDR